MNKKYFTMKLKFFFRLDQNKCFYLTKRKIFVIKFITFHWIYSNANMYYYYTVVLYFIYFIKGIPMGFFWKMFQLFTLLFKAAKVLCEKWRSCFLYELISHSPNSIIYTLLYCLKVDNHSEKCRFVWKL